LTSGINMGRSRFGPGLTSLPVFQSATICATA
jgi:hypothetical protein